MTQHLLAVVDAEGTGTEGHDLDQATGHREVLQEVEQLVLVAQRVVKDERGGDREDGQSERDGPGAVARQQQQAAAQFDGNGRQVAQQRRGQAHRGDVALGRLGRCDLAKSADDEDRRQEDASDERQDGGLGVGSGGRGHDEFPG
ncbi:hypothetical protein D3C87_1486550 [compost metagenome]